MKGSLLTGARQDNLAELVEQARNGDRDSFDRLIRVHEQSVLKTALYLTRNWEDAEDVAQEVYIKMLRKLDGFDNPDKIRRWVYRITVNTARDHLRRRRFFEPLKEVLGFSKPRDPVEGSQIRTRLKACMARLPFSERACFILWELHECSATEIADVLGCREVTVRGHLHRARKKLKDYLSEFREES